MFGDSECEWFDEPRDERELTRLQLVGLAAEIAAVAEHAQSRLLPEGLSPSADAQRARCRSFLRSAYAVLSHDAPLQSMTMSQLQEAVRSMRALQRKVQFLRGDTDLPTDTLLG